MPMVVNKIIAHFKEQLKVKIADLSFLLGSKQTITAK